MDIAHPSQQLHWALWALLWAMTSAPGSALCAHSEGRTELENRLLVVVMVGFFFPFLKLGWHWGGNPFVYIFNK